ncbi:hypothetical protein [Stagnihabitans tardus]|uniref:Uncharacterized protein n=1 Tax=Stagnihabitans tardus TaxID=2699202 RepID=A0AAE4Y7J7_9RHOB|nr:hypothetical protein [Stagnihabitans tardus]NBZ87253.1 hypothetical protein [Stagnihabitans tardus]
MKRFLILLALAACGTPQEQCIRGVSSDLATLDRLIAETRGNIARGYGYETRVEMMPEWVDCTPRPTEANPTPKPQMCFDDVAQEVRRPVSLDLRAEQAKLDSMVERRDQMAAAMAPALAACKARYPE